ncbi:hypothetical protein PRO82_000390 [Candidatus Protochlamydia amoebophila]|nr:hypothetical protein [Candidatus Protochlamydia amoebophila]
MFLFFLIDEPILFACYGLAIQAYQCVIETSFAKNK